MKESLRRVSPVIPSIFDIINIKDSLDTEVYAVVRDNLRRRMGLNTQRIISVVTGDIYQREWRLL